MTGASLHTLGMHANHLSRHVGNEKLQTILNVVAVGSIVIMGMGATVHLFRDLTRPHEDSHRKYHELHRELSHKERHR